MAIKAKARIRKDLRLLDETATDLEKLGTKNGFKNFHSFIETILTAVSKTGKFDISKIKNN